MLTFILWCICTVMLCWFIDENVATQAIHNEIIFEKDKVEVQPKRVSMKSLDENVCIHLIKKYFTFDPLNQVEMVGDILKGKGCWICRVCL